MMDMKLINLLAFQRPFHTENIIILTILQNTFDESTSFDVC